MWTDLSKWAKDVKILVSHVNAHQKVTSAEKLNNQVDRMTRSVDSSLFPQPFLSLLNGINEQSGHGGSDEGYIWAQQHGPPLTKDDLSTAATVAKSTNNRDQH